MSMTVLFVPSQLTDFQILLCRDLYGNRYLKHQHTFQQVENAFALLNSSSCLMCPMHEGTQSSSLES